MERQKLLAKDNVTISGGKMFHYIPVRGRVKEACWVIKKMSLGDIKNITQWFWMSDNEHSSNLSIQAIYQLPLLGLS